MQIVTKTINSNFNNINNIFVIYKTKAIININNLKTLILDNSIINSHLRKAKEISIRTIIINSRITNNKRMYMIKLTKHKASLIINHKIINK